MDRRAPDLSRAGSADHRDHDVRYRRNHRAAHEPFRYRAPAPGRHRRVHGVYPVEFPARADLAGTLRERGGYRGGVFENACTIPDLFGKYFEYSVVVGHPGIEDLPGGIALRRQ